MTDTQPDGSLKRRPGRARFVDRGPAPAALVALTEADEWLRELRRAETPDLAELNCADLARARATGNLVLALRVAPMWPARQLRRRGWLAKRWIPSDRS